VTEAIRTGAEAFRFDDGSNGFPTACDSCGAAAGDP
jgi:hypothetical protein